MNSLMNLSPKALRQAASIQERIGSLQKELAHILGAAPVSNGGSAPHRTMSAAGRARIAAAARARWAKQRGSKPAKGRKPGRRMSAAAKAKLAAIARKRWAAAKSAGKMAL